MRVGLEPIKPGRFSPRFDGFEFFNPFDMWPRAD